MLMKSDLYWHVIPKPRSLQNPVSFFITYQKKCSWGYGPKALPLCLYYMHIILSIHFTTYNVYNIFKQIFHLRRYAMLSKTYRFSGRNSSMLTINIDRIVQAENHWVKHFLTWKK